MVAIFAWTRSNCSRVTIAGTVATAIHWSGGTRHLRIARLADRVRGRAADAGGTQAGAVGVDGAGGRRVRQDATDGRHPPVLLPARGSDAPVVQALHHGHERPPLVGVPAEQVGHHRRVGRVGADAGRVPRAVRVGAIAERRPRPRQHLPAPQLVQPAAAGALGDERPLVLGDGPADVEQQLVLRVVGQRAIDELHPAPVPRQLLQQQDLVHVVAGQSVGVGDPDAVQLGQGGQVPELVQAGPPQRRPGVPVVAEHVVLGQLPAAVSGDAPQAFELLVDGLRLGLALGRDADGDRGSHRSPPRGGMGNGRRPIRAAVGRRGPTAARRRGGSGRCGAPSRIASWGSSQGNVTWEV